MTDKPLPPDDDASTDDALAPAAAPDDPLGNYRALQRTWQRLHHFSHLHAMAYWDEATQMPAGGAEARAAALAELCALMHRIRTAPRVQRQLNRAAAEPLDAEQMANLLEMDRDWRKSNALPEDLVARQQLATARCAQAWRRLRPANDWAGFAPLLREVVALAREQARLLSYQCELSPYDCLLDQHEPGMTSARLDTLFGDLRQWLPPLIARARATQAQRPPLPLQGPFDLDRQRALCAELVEALGFDLRAGRLDISVHPFAGGTPEDVRLTNRYRADDLLGGLYGAIHECGHGRYEQGLPRPWLGQPLGWARSMALHESQSLAFEMQLAPRLVAHFGPQPAFAADNLDRLVNQVQPGLIRVDADELTYPAHILLRWQIERGLIEGEVGVDDIPALWDAGMAELLGLDTRGNHRDGAMQDMHWPEGMFGYFPCYTLGAMYAAQWFAAMRRAMPTLDADIARGELSGLMGWLARHIWQQGSRWPTDELAQRASGEALNPAHYRQHLERRYGG